jgi:hypothetical protein
MHGLHSAEVKCSLPLMNQRAIANGIGCLSVACSLTFWAWAGLFLFTPLNRSDAWLNLGVGAGAKYLWPTLWISGLSLALISAALGAREWILAAILALASFAAAALMISSTQW